MNTELKSGFAAIIGRPNVGKSTLMNHLIGQKIAITSRKPQTTRNRIRTVYTCDRGQIVFQDTPGIHKAGNKLGEYMLRAAVGAARHADAILWLVEPDPRIGDTDARIGGFLQKSDLPVILAVNKIDQVKKKAIREAVRAFETLGAADEIVPVSARLGTGLDVLKDTLFRYMPCGPLYYDEDTVTDQSVKQIAAELIREKALRCLGDEIPHGIAVMIEEMREREDGIFNISAVIVCEKNSHKGMIIGKGGSMLKRIGSEARVDIERMVEAKVYLKLRVKVRKDWRDSELLMKNCGYDAKDLDG